MTANKKPYGLTIKETASALTKGELTSVHLVGSCLERINALEEKIQAWALVDREGARRQRTILTKNYDRDSDGSPSMAFQLG